MINILKIAAKNLLRYRRRTFLTSLLITIGIVAVLLFMSLSGSFRALMVGHIDAPDRIARAVHPESLHVENNARCGDSGNCRPE